MKIALYYPERKKEWDEFVKKSKNPHFLFFRDYMEYHKSRFEDHSLVVYGHHGKLIALLPGHITEQTFSSHAGLTYGGFITCEKMTTSLMIAIFETLISYLREKKIVKLYYKTTPHIHHRFPAEEDRYALFTLKAELIRRDVTTVLTSKERPVFQKRRQRGVLQATKVGIDISETSAFASFWEILTLVLLERHQVKPIHSLEEILCLQRLFPSNIRLFGAFLAGKMLGGVLIYETVRVARSQYIAVLPEGREHGALDLLFDHLINRVYHKTPFFDFGPSTEKNGFFLNRGLIEQKEGFGGRCLTLDHYELNF